MIHFPTLLCETVTKQMSWGEKFVPCNPDGGGIHLSEEEFRLFIKGGGFPMHHLWPVVADQHGITLMERSKIVRPVKVKEGEEEMD